MGLLQHSHLFCKGWSKQNLVAICVICLGWPRHLRVGRQATLTTPQARGPLNPAVACLLLMTRHCGLDALLGMPLGMPLRELLLCAQLSLHGSANQVSHRPQPPARMVQLSCIGLTSVKRLTQGLPPRETRCSVLVFPHRLDPISHNLL